MKLTKRALDRPVTTLMIFVCFVCIGMIASRLLPMEFMPDIDFPGVGVGIPYPGSTPEEIETRITRPVEEALATISGVKRMFSYSNENRSSVNLRFDWGVDTDIKAVEVKEKVDSIRHLLPADIEHINLRQESSGDSQILILRLSSTRDLSGYYSMLNRVLKQPLERLEGVSRVEMYGVDKKEIRIRLSADRIIAHGVDLGRLSETLRRSNFVLTAGRITDGSRRYRVRPMGEFTTIKELEELIVGENNLRLKDMADVSYERPVLTYGRHLDRKYAVGLDVYKESGANIVQTVERIKKELERIGEDPRMEGISIYQMEDQAEGITGSLNELFKSGIIGAGLAILLLFFFLRRWSTTFIVALAVPFSLLITLAVMYFFNVSLNILSMLGLMLAVGMLVDNAVVVTESIHRHQMRGQAPGDASITGVKEVALAITAGTLTTAIVFLPFIVVQSDIISIYLKYVSIAFVVALGASLVLAQTIVPLLTSRVRLPKKRLKKNFIDGLMKRYGRVLDWTVREKGLSLLIIVLVLGSVVIPFSKTKQDMFPQHDDRRLFLTYYINGHYTVAKIEAAVDTVEEYLYSNRDAFEIQSVYSYYEGGHAESTILLKKGKGVKKNQEQIRREIEAGMPKLAVGRPSFERRRSMGAGERLKIYLKGKSSAQLVELSHDVAKALARVPGLIDVRSDADAGEQEVQVVVDRERARMYGFSARQVADMVSAAMRGVNLRRFRDEYGEIDVRAGFSEGDKQTMDQLKQLVLYDNQNRPVKLSSLANFHLQGGPRAIFRENRITSMGVTINLKDTTVDEGRKKIRDIMNRYYLPPGFDWSFGRSFDEGAEVFKTMMINLVLAIFLIYFIMAALFESLIFPAAIITSIIFAVIGDFWFFWITGTTFSFMALIGILILIGVVVNNGIVLIDHINRYRERGLNRHAAIVKAGRERIRPILMTAGTTVLSLVPLCLVNTQIGGDGPPYYPMARAIVGGLTFSTVVTLLILPRIYVLLDDLRNWARRVIRRGSEMSRKPVFKKQ